MGPFPCCSLFFWGIFCYTTSSLIQTHLVQANKSNGHKPSSSSSLRLSSKDLPSSTSFARIQDSPQLLLIPVQQQQQKKKSKASSSMSGGAAAVTSRGGGGEGDGDTTTVSAVATSAATAVPPTTTTTTTSPATTTAATKQDKLSWEKIKTTIFPIYGRHERTKFLLLGSIKFFIILALTLTRDAKDTLVVPQCGAEAIAFLKIYGVLPAATAYIALYSNLSNRLSKTTLFYVTCIPFFVFFALFDMFIFPNTKILHPSLESVQAILSSGYNKLLGVRQPAATEAAQATVALSGGLAVMATIFANWTSALFYVMAEIYSSVSVGLLFWQFANDVVSVDQGKQCNCTNEQVQKNDVKGYRVLLLLRTRERVALYTRESL
jgi:TLC ATP/ADP transporter